MIRSLSRLVLALVVIGAIAIALSGPGYRVGWWALPVAFGTLRWGTWIVIGITVIALVLALIAGFAKPGGTRAGLPEAVVAVVIGAVTITGPLMLMSRGKGVPPIHDITTDTADPPQFVAVAPLRAGAPNTMTYGGPDLAAQQKKAYPQIVPLELPVPPERAYEEALAAARDMGWTIVSADAAGRRIEATATTPFFGFKDDVVVRVGATDKGSRIDVRSLSRIGRSDLGANARRIESYLGRIKG